MKKALMLAFVMLAIIDLVNCIIPGQEISVWFRPIQMLVLMFWVNQLKLAPKRSIILSIPLVMAAFMDYLFFKFGAALESVIIFLIFIKYSFFLYLLYLDIGELRLTKKLFRWAFNYLVIFIVIAALVGGKGNILAYMLGIQVAIIFLFISLKKSDAEIFRQKYLGYCLIIFSLIFGKILLADSRWFVELISRFAFVLGHFLFVSGLANVKLFPIKSNTLDYQAVK